MKHTPGPWKAVVTDRESREAIVAVAEGYTRNFYECIVEVNQQEEWEGNARLIAAAPDLYEALIKSADMLMSAAECLFRSGLEDSDLYRRLKAQESENRAIIGKVGGN